jgi:hypothetical protein
MQKTLFFSPRQIHCLETINVEEGGAGELQRNEQFSKTLFFKPTPD